MALSRTLNDDVEPRTPDLLRHSDVKAERSKHVDLEIVHVTERDT
jgi:hypothetical protein